ncbi:hypothetical protein [Luteibacter anthropi]|uniref:Uncharacterized protein n=1 Tax=Luteibacter anthropi TaxID=564369 RepID=A0A7X5U874_9GAMM|nr:hypothetical protein [Luteibacter anthropi]NII05656.1 hypothetical protein [Luteibacter anthropi]
MPLIALLATQHQTMCKKARIYAGSGDLQYFLLPSHIGQRITPHSIINRSRKPAWLKGFAMIDMGHYRRLYRHPTRAFSAAEDGKV